MDIFKNIGWTPMWLLIEERPFTPRELATIKSAHVVEAEYGLSVCFILKSLEKKHIPISNSDSTFHEGEDVDPANLYVMTFERSYDPNEHIFRVRRAE